MKLLCVSVCLCDSPFLSLPQSSGDELDEFEVELYKEGRGLGITIAGLASEDTGGQSSTRNTATHTKNLT